MSNRMDYAYLWNSYVIKWNHIFKNSGFLHCKASYPYAMRINWWIIIFNNVVTKVHDYLS